MIPLLKKLWKFTVALISSFTDIIWMSIKWAEKSRWGKALAIPRGPLLWADQFGKSWPRFGQPKMTWCDKICHPFLEGLQSSPGHRQRSGNRLDFSLCLNSGTHSGVLDPVPVFLKGLSSYVVLPYLPGKLNPGSFSLCICLPDIIH